MKKIGKMIFEVLGNSLHKAATVLYPAVKITMPDKFRGRLAFHAESCIGCKFCMRDCPTNAIVIEKIGDKQFEAVIDCAKCIYCAQCVDSCPKQALTATPAFELAQLTRAKLIMVCRGEQPAATSEDRADPPGHPETTA